MTPSIGLSLNQSP